MKTISFLYSHGIGVSKFKKQNERKNAIIIILMSYGSMCFRQPHLNYNG